MREPGKAIASPLTLTMAQMALAWVLLRSEVSSTISGVSRPEQIADDVRAIGVSLPFELLVRVDEALGNVIVKTDEGLRILSPLRLPLNN
jgi:aryl-alcohol dehydrogenase-like predicted oxidoreductase